MVKSPDMLHEITGFAKCLAPFQKVSIVSLVDIVHPCQDHSVYVFHRCWLNEYREVSSFQDSSWWYMSYQYPIICIYIYMHKIIYTHAYLYRHGSPIADPHCSFPLWMRNPESKCYSAAIQLIHHWGDYVNVYLYLILGIFHMYIRIYTYVFIYIWLYG